MDALSYSRLLSYVVCEMTMPIKKHVYNFAVSDQTSMNPQLLSTAALTAKSQIQINSQIISSNLSNNIDMSGAPIETEDETIEYEIQELCEGTEIEKSALGYILNHENCDQNKTELKYSYVPTSSNQDTDFLEMEEEMNADSTQSVLKRMCYSTNEDKLLQPVSKKFKDISDEPSKHTKCLDRIGKVTVSSGSNLTISKDSTLNSDPMLLCSDGDFKLMFKVSRSTFQVLVDILSDEELEPIEDVSLHKKILIVLWLLGTSGSNKEAARVFEVSEETVSSCFFDICATLYNKSENFIKWPSSDESDEIASRIEENFGFPGVVGVLGCQYFTISIPKESLSRREHFNGKLRMYCVALQLVCDDELVIRDIFPGLPGGTRPAQVLRDSTLGELLTSQPAELIDPNKHILAPSEFPQFTSMLTPYAKKSESLTQDEEEFNSLHGNVCLLADQTFKMLKDRFRVLKLLDPETATMVLVTTCVLHNICVQNGDT